MIALSGIDSVNCLTREGAGTNSCKVTSESTIANRPCLACSKKSTVPFFKLFIFMSVCQRKISCNNLQNLSLDILWLEFERCVNKLTASVRTAADACT